MLLLSQIGRNLFSWIPRLSKPFLVLNQGLIPDMSLTQEPSAIYILRPCLKTGSAFFTPLQGVVAEGFRAYSGCKVKDAAQTGDRCEAWLINDS